MSVGGEDPDQILAAFKRGRGTLFEKKPKNF